MKCLACNLTPICKIYEFAMLQKNIADITVNSCKMINDGYKPNTSLPTEIRAPEDLLTRSERIRSFDVPKREVNIVACSSCTYEDDAFNMIHDAGANKYYCETCWDKI